MRYYEDFQVGDRFDFADYRMDEAEMLAYARDFDPRPMHLDPEAAQESIHGGLTASGIMILAIALRQMVEGFRDTAALGSPGWDEVRFHAPVRAGDTLSVSCEILGMRPSASRPTLGIMRGRFTVSNQADDLVLTTEPTWLMARRP